MFRERVFRINLAILGFVMTSFIAVYHTADVLLAHRDLIHTSVELLSFYVLVWVLSAGVWKWLPTYASPAGIRSTDGVGRYFDVPWENIQKVFTFSGFIWVRHGKLGTALCIPQFLEDPKAFRSYVIEHAPEGNPLRVYFERFV